MLSKTKIKWINSLERKKNRDEQGVFVAEGIKIVADLFPFLKCKFLAISESFKANDYKKYTDEIEIISPEEYKKISFQKSPQGVLAVFEKPNYKIDFDEVAKSLTLALDDIQDPGNLGTIIRLADWFGVKDVFCSLQTSDVFSPKAVQATMGAIARVRVHYVDLLGFLGEMQNKTRIYGTFMDGKNIFEEKLDENGIIVMGNEGNGISPQIEELISRKISIPNYSNEKVTSESLNVGIATAIVVAEFRKRKF